MNWKTYYQEELDRPVSRVKLRRWIEPDPDPLLLEAIARGAILSFPHTYLDSAGPLQASVVSGLYHRKVESVLALGVLHSSGLPAYRLALDDGASTSDRARAFAVVAGAHSPGSENTATIYGELPVPTLTDGPFRVDRSGLLESEFSLDTFLALMCLASDVFGQRAIPVLPLFVGMTRNPLDRSFGVADGLAAWLREVIGPGTAIVTTGDLVHFGTAYGWEREEVEGAGQAHERVRELRGRVENTLQMAFEGQAERAYETNLRRLRNDQREILPVLVAYLEPRCRVRVLEFGLADYASILNVDSPCLVASALVAYG